MASANHRHQAIEPTRDDQRHALRWALLANGGFMVVEIIAGVTFSSLALLADGAHMVSDVLALSVALVAHRLVAAPPSDRHSYGLQRAEVLGAQVNAGLLLAGAGWVSYLAIRRLDEPSEVVGGGLVVVAAVGLAINLVSAVMLARARGKSLNMQGALTHMLADAAGSAVAVGAGVAVLVWGQDRADSIASLAIALLVVWSAVSLLRESAHVLLEGTPRHIDPEAVSAAMTAVDGVVEVHHLHVWNLASDVPALSAHLVMAGEISLHEAQERAVVVKERLAAGFGIEHATLELECHECPEPAPNPD